MKINQHQLLHYVLIILLMIAPIRGAVAMQQSHCDMDDNTVYTSADISDHSIAHDMTAMTMADTSEQYAEKTLDCCSDSSTCVDDCDMNISASLLIHESSFTPNYSSVSRSVTLITNLLIREFTTPFRPPLVVHS